MIVVLTRGEGGGGVNAKYEGGGGDDGGSLRMNNALHDAIRASQKNRRRR